MEFSELKTRRLQPNGDVVAASRANSSSRHTRSSTTKKPSKDSNWAGREISAGDESLTDHCRGCALLRVFRMPSALTVGGKWLQVETVSSEGKPFDLAVERVAGKMVATCLKGHWSGKVTSLRHLIKPTGYFWQQAQVCADFAVADDDQIRTLRNVCINENR